MLRHLEQRPSLEKLAIVRTTAQGLAVDLEQELVRLDEGLHYGIPFPELYNNLYLPIARAIADDLAGVASLQILRSPLRPDLATTQLRTTLQQLYRLLSALSDI